MKLMIAKIRDHGWGFLLAIVFLTVEAVCDLLQPAMLSKIVDEGVAKGDTGLITQLALSMLGIALLGRWEQWAATILPAMYRSASARSCGGICTARCSVFRLKISIGCSPRLW